MIRWRAGHHADIDNNLVSSAMSGLEISELPVVSALQNTQAAG
jgi:hypothetical protein